MPSQATFMFRLWGVFILSFSLPFILRRNAIKESVKFVEQSSTRFVLAVILLLIGSFSVAFYDKLVCDTSIIVTLLGWIVLLKGIYAVLFPETFVKNARWVVQHTVLYTISLILMVLLGTYFVYLGFF